MDLWAFELLEDFYLGLIDGCFKVKSEFEFMGEVKFYWVVEIRFSVDRVQGLEVIGAFEFEIGI